jgi:hypothetical protein
MKEKLLTSNFQTIKVINRATQNTIFRGEEVIGWLLNTIS